MPFAITSGLLYNDAANSPSITIYNGTTSGTTALNFQNQRIWTSWTDSTTSAISYVWPRWVEDAYGARAYANYQHSGQYNNYNQAPVIDQRTPDQVLADLAAQVAQVEAATRRASAERVRRAEASARARALLEALLDEQQRAQLARDQFFEIVSRGSRRRYRIRHGTHGNVRLLDDRGREVTQYCGQPNGVPTEDAMLAQMLQLTHDEEGFLRAANATRLVA